MTAVLGAICGKTGVEVHTPYVPVRCETDVHFTAAPEPAPLPPPMEPPARPVWLPEPLTDPALEA